MSTNPLFKQTVAATKKNPSPETSWSTKAYELARQARSANVLKLAPIIRNLQRISGRRKRECVTFVVSHIDDKSRYSKWTDEELDQVREFAVSLNADEIAKKIRRSPDAVRSMCKRQGIRLREVRCDLFSINTVASILRVRKRTIREWIDQGWLEATIIPAKKKSDFRISPEALQKCFRLHQDELKIPSLNAFRAYCEYCFVPKHTIGEQLLQVRQAKRERAAFDLSIEEQE